MHIKQNYTDAYIAIDSLQGLVNYLLVWQSICKSKLATCPLNSKSVSPVGSAKTRNGMERNQLGPASILKLPDFPIYASSFNISI